MTSEVCIQVDHVAKSFGKTKAVRELELSVPCGSLCGFLGPNGAGKSTTIRMLMSIIRPDSGNISVLGGDAISHKDRIGYLPEERGVYRKMRVGEFLRFIARLKGLPGNGLDARIKGWLERIELEDSFRSRCEELSKGMQQKVQFLASVIHEPELIILDEPFSGLDPVNAMLLNRIITELHEEGRTIVFSTHVLHQAERMCDRIILFDQGQKILDDSLDQIRTRFNPRTVTIDPIGNPQTCLEQAKKIDGLASARLDEDDIIHLKLHEDHDPAIAMREILENISVRSIERGRATLDEVFVKLVGEPRVSEMEATNV